MANLPTLVQTRNLSAYLPKYALGQRELENIIVSRLVVVVPSFRTSKAAEKSTDLNERPIEVDINNRTQL